MADMVTRVTRATRPVPAPYRVRTAAIALAVAGILFVLYPALRQYTDETTLDGARAFTSNAWVASHVMGMIGFIGLAIGLLGVHFVQRTARRGRRSFWAALLTWTGVGLILTYYGIAVALYLPQFFGPPSVRMAHGVLLAVGCLWLAIGLWDRRAAEPRPVYNGQRPEFGVPAPRSAPWP